MKVIVKSKKYMWPYIALHGLMPQNELPVRFRGKIPKDEIWFRQDVWDDRMFRDEVLSHEEDELTHMIVDHMNYKHAHWFASVRDGFICEESRLKLIPLVHPHHHRKWR